MLPAAGDFDFRQHDLINMCFDGFRDERNAMAFATNPYGVQRDLLAFDRIAGDQRIRCLFNLGGGTIDIAALTDGAMPLITLNGADNAALPPCGTLWLKMEG